MQILLENASLFVHVFAAIAFGVLVAPRALNGALEMRNLFVWLSVVPIVLFAREPLYIVLGFLVLLALLTPATSLDRIKFFVLIVPAAPGYIESNLPFPGINYFFDLDHYKAACLAVLLPTFLMRRGARNEYAPWSIVDTCVAAYVVYTSLQMGWHFGLNGGARFALEQVFLIVLPYFAIRWVITSAKDVREVFSAFIVAAVILAAIALLSSLRNWDFYRFEQGDALSMFSDYRDGSLRVQATLNTHSLAFVLVLALLLLQYVKQYVSMNWFHLWGLRGLLFAAAMTPGSRGALAGLAVGAVIYLLLSVKAAWLRWTMIFGLAVCGAIGGYILMFGDVAKFDAHGSFVYRQMLIDTSIKYIADHPFFGDLRFLQSGRFDHLVQGQGIVDVTNLYLQVLLKHGLIGGLLLFGPIFLVIAQLSFRAMSLSRNGDPERREMRGACIAISAGYVGWLLLIATTSDVGL
ncbi:MAG: O-antigen ligase family protein, partial [Pseudomonadota bacterium]